MLKQRKIMKMILLVILVIIIQSLSAKKSSVPYYRCLPGEYLNSPTLLNYIRENNLELEMYSYKNSEGCFDNIYVENGRIVKITFEQEMDAEWPKNFFPKDWGIKIPYKAMYKTDTWRYPDWKLDAIDEYKDISITKEVDDIKLDLTYRTNYKKHLLKFVTISGNAENCKDCEKNALPPDIWKRFLGEDGDKLTEWLYQNMGKEFTKEYLDSNFIPVAYSTYSYFKGKYYMSMDGTTLLGLESDTVNSMVFYPQIIPVDVFPSITRSLTSADIKIMYPEIEEKEKDSGHLIMKTQNYIIEFNMQESDSLHSIAIHLNNDGTDELHQYQFPFVASRKPIDNIKSFNLNQDMLRYNENPIIRAETDSLSVYWSYNGTYDFKIKKGVTAELFFTMEPATRKIFIAEFEEEVYDVQMKLIKGYYKSVSEATNVTVA